jgi:hypothetical protein
VSTTYRTGLSVMVRIWAISARAAEGLECVSTTSTPSSSMTTAALQLITGCGRAMAA